MGRLSPAMIGLGHMGPVSLPASLEKSRFVWAVLVRRELILGAKARCFLCIFGLILIFERCLQFFSYCLREAVLVAAGDLSQERLLPAVTLWFCHLLPQPFGHRFLWEGLVHSLGPGEYLPA